MWPAWLSLTQSVIRHSDEVIFKYVFLGAQDHHRSLAFSIDKEMGNKYTGSVPALWERKLHVALWLHSAATEHEIETTFADFTALPVPWAHICRMGRLPDTHCHSRRRWFCGSGSGSSWCGAWRPCGCTQSSSWSPASWPPAQHCGCTPQRTLGREQHCFSDGTDTPSSEPGTRDCTHRWAEPGNDDLHEQQFIKLQNIIRKNICKWSFSKWQNPSVPNKCILKFRKNYSHPFHISNSHNCSWLNCQKPLILW